MGMKHIRKTYSVPAKRGARIEFEDGDGIKHLCTIFSTIGSHLKVRADGVHSGRQYWILHPTWNVTYLNGNEKANP